ncbi:MAG: pesticin C-terminus-like muramidase [Actinomycetota bacterium]
MSFQGMQPDKVRDLIAAMNQAEAEADALSGDVTAALTLSELESPTPAQLLAISDELDAVAVVLNTRVDIVEGYVIDPEELATELGITIAQAETAIAKLTGDDIGKDDTPLIDLLVEQRQGAAILRQSFVGLPETGVDPELDAAFIRLGSWLAAALEAGEVPDDLTDQQITDLALFQRAVVGLNGAAAIAAGEGIGAGIRSGFANIIAAGGDIPLNQGFGEALFEQIAEAYELDSRLRKAAGLPTVEDLHFHYAKHTKGSQRWNEEWAALDEWLPAYLAGEGPATDDPAQWALAASLAANMGWRGPFGRDFDGLSAADQQAQLDAALAHLRGGRFLQRSLIPGDFEGLDGPNIIWTDEGINSALLAGERQGVINEQSRAVAQQIADGVLGGGDGAAIELSEEQQQALVAAIAAQNGQEFVTDNDAIQRQIVAALNLIGQQTTLAEQKRIFANTIEAFRSLNVVGAPAVTYRQLKEIVGPDVDEELGYKTLTARSAKATGKRPQLLSLVAHWGIPGKQKFKTKKRKFRFEFDEQGRLVDIRNKKISKWKRFKNTIKAIGKSLWKEWTDNPWKYLFMGPAGLMPGANQFAEGVEDLDFDDMFDGAVDMTKFAATVAATVLPPSSAAGIAAWAAVAADTINDIQNDDWLGVASNALSAVGMAGGEFGGAIGAIADGADVAAQVIDTIQSGDRLLDAIDGGDLIDIVTSGLNFAGDLAPVVGGEAVREFTDFTANAAQFIRSGSQIVDGISDGNLLGILDGAVGLATMAADDGDPERTRNEGLLLALDQGLDVANLVDTAYRSGVVPDYATIATELAEFAGASATVPAAPIPPAPPLPTRTAGQPQALGVVDTNGDGAGDGIAIDTNGDGRVDALAIDTNGDGRADTAIRLASQGNGAGSGEPTPEQLDALVALAAQEELAAGGGPILPSPSRPGPDLDWEFIGRLEGGQRLDGYLPDEEQGANNNTESGVTVGTGVDLGQRSASDIDALPISAGLKAKLKPYTQLTGLAAEQAIDTQPLQLTQAEANELDNAVKAASLDQIESLYNDAIAPGKTPFAGLPREAQTAISSVAFQYGAGLATETPTFWRHITSQDWPAALGELRNFQDEFPTRRNREGDLIESMIGRLQIPHAGFEDDFRLRQPLPRPLDLGPGPLGPDPEPPTLPNPDRAGTSIPFDPVAGGAFDAGLAALASDNAGLDPVTAASIGPLTPLAFNANAADIDRAESSGNWVNVALTTLGFAADVGGSNAIAAGGRELIDGLGYGPAVVFELPDIAAAAFDRNGSFDRQGFTEELVAAGFSVGGAFAGSPLGPLGSGAGSYVFEEAGTNLVQWVNYEPQIHVGQAVSNPDVVILDATTGDGGRHVPFDKPVSVSIVSDTETEQRAIKIPLDDGREVLLTNDDLDLLEQGSVADWQRHLGGIDREEAFRTGKAIERLFDDINTELQPELPYTFRLPEEFTAPVVFPDHPLMDHPSRTGS